MVQAQQIKYLKMILRLNVLTGTGVVEVKVDGTETITVKQGEVGINVTDPKAKMYPEQVIILQLMCRKGNNRILL